jgi:hypothetical protein
LPVAAANRNGRRRPWYEEVVADPSAIAATLAPGVALTSAVIYWANLQSRLDAIATRVRTLNGELRLLDAGAARAGSVERQVAMLTHRSRVLHVGVVLSVVALFSFLSSSAVLFVAATRLAAATALFMLGLACFGASLLTTLWEMLWARRSLEEDVSSSQARTRSP